MALYEINGIILSSRALGESDRTYKVLSRNNGVVELKAKGVRKIKSKLSGHLRTFGEVKLRIAKSKTNYDIITGVETITDLSGVMNSLDLLVPASSAANLISVLAKGDKNHIYYESFKKYLKSILENPDNARYLALAYGYKLLTISGFGPEISRCVECSKPYNNGDWSFSSLRGGLLCGDEPQLETIQISNKEINAFGYMIRTTLEDMAQIDFNKEFDNLTLILKEYIRVQLGNFSYTLVPEEIYAHDGQKKLKGNV